MTPAPAASSSGSSTPGAEPLDALVIGGGPAGLTAATYLARYRRTIAVVDAGHSRARWIPTSHNCPGFPLGVGGEKLLRLYREQAGTYGVVPDSAQITCLERDGGVFRATADDGRQWGARHVVLATGVVDGMPAVDGLTAAIAAGAVRFCPICDAWEAGESGSIAVLAPLATGFKHALFLRTYSAAVSVLPVDGADAAADAPLRREAESAGIGILEAPERIHFDGQRIRVEFGTGKPCSFDSLYPFLGCAAQSACAQALGALANQDGELAVDADQQTTVDGLYAVGDVVQGLNQISVALGQAAVAATAIHNRLARTFRGA